MITTRKLLLLLALAGTPTARASDPSGTVTGAPGKGITLTSADDRMSLKVSTRVVPRFDLLLAEGDDGVEPTSRATISTARLWLSGHVFSKRVTYMTQLAYAGRDYRDGTISPVFDAYVDARTGDDSGVRVGQYFVRFDRLRTVREWALQMTDRPRPISELTLDRDVGITVYDDSLFGEGSPLAVHVGAFGGRGTNQLSTAAAGGLFAGRVELRPLGDIDDDTEGDLENREQAGLALGVGAAYNLNTTRVRSTTGSYFTSGTADYLHLAGDAVFKWRGLGVQAEYLRKDAATEEVGAPGDEVGWARSGQGVVGQVSYHVPVGEGAAGVEPVARFSKLWADEDTDPTFLAEVEAGGNEIGAGFNVYLNGHRCKVQTTWIGLYSDEFAAASNQFATQLDATF